MFGLDTGVSIALVALLVAGVVHWDRRLTRVEDAVQHVQKDITDIRKALDVDKILERAGG